MTNPFFFVGLKTDLFSDFFPLICGRNPEKSGRDRQSLGA